MLYMSLLTRELLCLYGRILISIQIPRLTSWEALPDYKFTSCESPYLTRLLILERSLTFRRVCVVDNVA